MPNHCSNSLLIKNTDNEQYQKFLEVVGEENCIFRELLPLPKGLRGIVSGSTTIDGERVSPYVNATVDGEALVSNGIGSYETMDGEPYDGEVKPRRLNEEEIKLQIEHGTVSWYSWNTDKWGTKWGMYDISVKENGGDSLFMTYDTAWCPAIKGLISVSKMFDKLVFINSYAECGCDYYGQTHLRMGKKFMKKSIKICLKVLKIADSKKTALSGIIIAMKIILC